MARLLCLSSFDLKQSPQLQHQPGVACSTLQFDDRHKPDFETRASLEARIAKRERPRPQRTSGRMGGRSAVGAFSDRRTGASEIPDAILGERREVRETAISPVASETHHPAQVPLMVAGVRPLARHKR